MNDILKLASDTSILQAIVQVAARRGWIIEQKKPAHAIAADSWRFDPAATTYATYRGSDGAEVGLAVADVVKKLRLRPAAVVARRICGPHADADLHTLPFATHLRAAGAESHR